MRGADETVGSLFSDVDLEERIAARHPLRKIRQVVNDALDSLDAEFEELYTDFGRACRGKFSRLNAAGHLDSAAVGAEDISHDGPGELRPVLTRFA